MEGNNYRYKSLVSVIQFVSSPSFPLHPYLTASAAAFGGVVHKARWRGAAEQRHSRAGQRRGRGRDRFRGESTRQQQRRQIVGQTGKSHRRQTVFTQQMDQQHSRKYRQASQQQQQWKQQQRWSQWLRFAAAAAANSASPKPRRGGA